MGSVRKLRALDELADRLEVAGVGSSDDRLGTGAEQHDLDVRLEPMLGLQGEAPRLGEFAGIVFEPIDGHVASVLVVDDQELRHRYLQTIRLYRGAR